MTLALTPEDLFEKGFSEIRNESASIIPEYPAIETFIKYLQTTWLPKMKKVSVHDCPIRTNNISESYNNIVSSKLGKGKKNVWKFLEHLEQLLMDEEIKVKRLSTGQSKQLANGRLTLKEYLLSFYKGNKIIMYGNEGKVLQLLLM
ncbi:uncharacterized protein LOC143363859 [Halictus rubicundus]|uniref:uncharacterized protein LOC143363859 n=1 Tax=Halictus rubicundus TaxID=77578 RepID=UPI004036A6CC